MSLATFTSVSALLATGVVPMLVAVLAYRQATRANRQTLILESRKVDGDAYDRAQGIYHDAIETLQAQLAAERKLSEDRQALIELQLVTAKQRIGELERRVAEMEAIREAGVALERRVTDIEGNDGHQ